ncbi:MAG: DUF4127 family protein [Faecousia sp.]
MRSKMRILAAVLCCLLLLQMIPVGSAVEPRLFSDVSESDWYYESVSEAVERGLMNGTSQTTFSPEETTTRAMLLTILYRMDGKKSVETDISFPDVAPDAWYAEAAAWGLYYGIVLGFEDGSFRPEEIITREQAALILLRYANYREFDVSASADLTAFGDTAQISPWAEEALAWTVGCGIFLGSDGLLEPLEGTTRAQIAAIACRFCHLFRVERFCAHGFTVCYLPLDNRPVNNLRPKWLAESCGIRLLMPDETLYATRLDGQTENPNGTTHGDRAALLRWIKENEESCDAFVISLDQLLSGGLVSSRALRDNDLSFEYLAMDYLAELSTRKPVYVFDTVMRLATTVNYQGLKEEEYDLFRSYGTVARAPLTEDELTIANIVKGYRYDENGELIPTPLDEKLLKNYLLARERKLRMAYRMLKNSAQVAFYFIGIDDSVPQNSIQTNEIAYLRGRLGENAQLFTGTDELGMMLLTRAYLDLCQWTPTLSVRYFGGKEDGFADAFDVTTLRESLGQHIAALGCQEVEADGDAEVLVLTRGCSEAEEAEFLQAWMENDAAGRATIVIDASGGQRAPASTVAAISLKHLLGYSAWGTAANAIGIGLSIGVSRLAWLTWEDEKQEADTEAFAKELVFAFVKDLAYCRGCREQLTDLTPEGIEQCLLQEPLTASILDTLAGQELTVSNKGETYTMPRATLTDFSAPFARTYEIAFSPEFLPPEE